LPALHLSTIMSNKGSIRERNTHTHCTPHTTRARAGKQERGGRARASLEDGSVELVTARSLACVPRPPRSPHRLLTRPIAHSLAPSLAHSPHRSQSLPRPIAPSLAPSLAHSPHRSPHRSLARPIARSPHSLARPIARSHSLARPIARSHSLTRGAPVGMGRRTEVPLPMRHTGRDLASAERLKKRNVGRGPLCGFAVFPSV
jgi:hypothetical protein